MDRHDNPYNLFPKEFFVVRMKHLHPGNSSKHERNNSKYLSYLEVIPRDTSTKEPIEELGFTVIAQCNSKDAPSREKAREILRLKAQVAGEMLGWINHHTSVPAQ